MASFLENVAFQFNWDKVMERHQQCNKTVHTPATKTVKTTQHIITPNPQVPQWSLTDDYPTTSLARSKIQDVNTEIIDLQNVIQKNKQETGCWKTALLTPTHLKIPINKKSLHMKLLKEAEDTAVAECLQAQCDKGLLEIHKEFDLTFKSQQDAYYNNTQQIIAHNLEQTSSADK